MSGLDDRGKGQEGMYVHEEEVQFKATIKRNSMFVDWVADELGVADADREAFREPYGITDLSDVSASAIITRAHEALTAAGNDISEHRLENLMAEFKTKALEIVREG